MIKGMLYYWLIKAIVFVKVTLMLIQKLYSFALKEY